MIGIAMYVASAIATAELKAANKAINPDMDFEIIETPEPAQEDRSLTGFLWGLFFGSFL